MSPEPESQGQTTEVTAGPSDQQTNILDTLISTSAMSLPVTSEQNTTNTAAANLDTGASVLWKGRTQKSSSSFEKRETSEHSQEGKLKSPEVDTNNVSDTDTGHNNETEKVSRYTTSTASSSGSVDKEWDGHRVSVCGTWSVPKLPEEGPSRPNSTSHHSTSSESSPHISALLGFSVESPPAVTTVQSVVVMTTSTQGPSTTTASASSPSTEIVDQTKTSTVFKPVQTQKPLTDSVQPISSTAVHTTQIDIHLTEASCSSSTATSTNALHRDTSVSMVTRTIDQATVMSSCLSSWCSTTSSTLVSSSTVTAVTESDTPLNRALAKLSSFSTKELAGHSRTCEAGRTENSR